MKTYKHKWYDHDTVYFNTDAGSCKINIYDESWRNRKVAEIYDLFVYPEQRGKGHGDELLNAALNRAMKEGCAVAVLWPDSDIWTRGWYRTKGFAPDERYRLSDKGRLGWSCNLTKQKPYPEAKPQVDNEDIDSAIQSYVDMRTKGFNKEAFDNAPLFPSDLRLAIKYGMSLQKKLMKKTIAQYVEKGINCMNKSGKAGETGNYTFWDGFNNCAENILRELKDEG